MYAIIVGTELQVAYSTKRYLQNRVDHGHQVG